MNFVVSFTYKVIFPKFSFCDFLISIKHHTLTYIAEITKNIHISIAVSVPFLRSEIPDIFIFILF